MKPTEHEERVSGILEALRDELEEKIAQGDVLALDPHPAALAHKYASIITKLGQAFICALSNSDPDGTAELFIDVAGDLVLAAESTGLPVRGEPGRVARGVVVNVIKEYRGTVRSGTSERCAYVNISGMECQPTGADWFVVTLGENDTHGRPTTLTRTPACFRHASMVTASWRRQHPEAPALASRLPEDPDELSEGELTMGSYVRMQNVELPAEDVSADRLLDSVITEARGSKK